MLSKPEKSGSQFTLPGFEGTVSRISDLPMDWCAACIFSLTNHLPLALCFEEDGGGNVTIASTDHATFLIANRETSQCSALPMNYRDFSLVFLRDLESNFEDWVRWSPFDTDYASRRDELAEGLEEIRRLLDSSSLLLT